jgi:hypothetical protein
LPLRTLNPPNLRRVARLAALARLKELQDVSAELIRIKVTTEEVKARKSLRSTEAKPGNTN